MNLHTINQLLLSFTQKSDWRILSDANGKPYSVDHEGKAGPYFSLSHTKDKKVSVYALSNAPIGVDIERWSSRDFTALADYAFGPREKQEIAEQGLPAFYRIWTIREAMSKVHGAGLTEVIDGTDRADGLKNGLQKRNDFNIFYSVDVTDHSLAVVYMKDIDLDEIDLHVYAVDEELDVPERFLGTIHKGQGNE